MALASVSPSHVCVCVPFWQQFLSQAAHTNTQPPSLATVVFAVGNLRQALIDITCVCTCCTQLLLGK